MKDKKEIKVTLKFHPNKALGQKYEVVKFVNVIVVEYDDPVDRNHKLPVRVGDYIDEASAKALNDVAEVTVLPE
jgi:hypothetical protein